MRSKLLLTPARPALWLAFALAAPLPGLASSAATSLRVQDVAVLAASCANCHGPDGRSTGVIPQLRGLPETHLLQRLQAFKAGTAKDATVMTRLAKGYDDEQLKALAQWFSKKGQ
ncbi:Flavocytochrome c cytochrome subunit [Comamonas testosteroni]|uniref:Flavocytochrome c cytochrome subunit n=1 Tax=Comamonas testosteroni TaxID=285 RepID=A0A8B4S779_COMTE|nr:MULTISPECIES: c-type cytochrome [Comamonas]RDI08380.1 cytochrome c553 [Comamonas sp. AG1104]SUY79349.1 Flavocytochrome c cytochrome subunit [Comamonas testosteroni]